MNGGDAKFLALLEDAFARGQTALAAGDITNARRWFERAHRMAPNDGTIALSLASALIGTDNAWATILFERVLSAGDVRDAKAGLITTRFLMGDIAAAGTILAETLSRYAPHPALPALADRVAAAADAPGWCGLTAAGALTIHPCGAVEIEARIDGRQIKGGVLPDSWPRARRITVVALTRAGEHHLLGSPIVPGAIAATEGYVEANKNGVTGWAWHPADPDTDPVLMIERCGHRRSIVATGAAGNIPGLTPLAKPRSFLVPWSALPAGDNPVHVRGRDGRGLTGGPVIRAAAALPLAKRPGPVTAPRGLTVLVRAASEALDAILATLPADVPVMVADSLELARFNGRVSRLEGDIVPVAQGHDLVLLDNVAGLPFDWLQRSRAAAYAGRDTGTVTPFSNRGQAAYPLAEGVKLSWFEGGESQLDRLAREANGDAVVTIPLGGGPCLFVRGDCFAATGPIRVTLFGEWDDAQADFCARASGGGWRHVALPGLFVGQSARPGSGAGATQIRARNAALLARLYPDPPASTAHLVPARRRLDLARWRDGAPPTSAIIVTHDDGGGVERRIGLSVSRHEAAGRRAIVMRPSPDENEAGVAVCDGSRRRYPNLRFALPREKAALSRLLRESHSEEVEIHHFLNHDPTVVEAVRAVRVPYDVHIHDFIWFCPRIALVGRRDRYCGEPDRAGCEACVAEIGGYLAEDISVAALLDRSRDIMSGARRVIAPSEDTAARMIRHFPGLPVTVVPHEDDGAVAEPPPIQAAAGRVLVCVAGAIGLHKGYHVLLACARDALKRDLDLAFVVVGTTIGDQRLLDTGRAFVTGRYEPEEAAALIRAQEATLALLPSIWPETWCLGLTELWRGGLRVAAFDFGAPAERIRRTGRGLLIPPGSSPRTINDMLLNAGKGRSLLPIPRSSAYKTSR